MCCITHEWRELARPPSAWGEVSPFWRPSPRVEGAFAGARPHAKMYVCMWHVLEGGVRERRPPHGVEELPKGSPAPIAHVWRCLSGGSLRARPRLWVERLPFQETSPPTPVCVHIRTCMSGGGLRARPLLGPCVRAWVRCKVEELSAPPFALSLFSLSACLRGGVGMEGASARAFPPPARDGL